MQNPNDDLPGRQRPPHEPPLWVDVSRETFFLTICAQDRPNSPLTPVAEQILDSIRFYHNNAKWWVHLAVIMPDHLHLLVSFPQEARFTEVVRRWKHWAAANLGISWQRDFFDHRLRGDEPFREKADYILQNPVRAKLVENWEDWPHFWMPRE